MHLSIPVFRASHRRFRFEAVIRIAFLVVCIVLISEAYSIRGHSIYILRIYFRKQIRKDIVNPGLFTVIFYRAEVHGLIES